MFNGKDHLLIADDEESVVDLLCMMLGKAYSISSVRSGTEAYALLASCGDLYCAAILDSNMPGIEGTRVAGLVRMAGVQTPIVICSGMLFEPEYLPTRTRFIAKPFRKDSLLATLVGLRGDPGGGEHKDV